jgi:hypothetical protein
MTDETRRNLLHTPNCTETGTISSPKNNYPAAVGHRAALRQSLAAMSTAAESNAVAAGSGAKASSPAPAGSMLPKLDASRLKSVVSTEKS